MRNHPSQRSLVIILSVISTITALTYLLSMLARGYQPDFRNGFRLKATGILSATSKPKSASVFVNHQLVTVTDDTINLIPGNYQITLEKDGYLPWKKNYQIEKELVYITDAFLFKSNPLIKTITSEAITKIKINKESTRIIYVDKLGLFLIENYPLFLGSYKYSPKLILPSTPLLNWNNFSFTFSPNSKQILATNPKKSQAYLINIEQTNSLTALDNIYSKVESIIKNWQDDELLANEFKIKQIPEIIKSNVATQSGEIMFSEGDSSFLYLSSLASPEKDFYHVYDLNLSKDYPIGPKSKITNPQWLPGTNNLVYFSSQNLFSIESDGTNLQKIYSSPRPIINLFLSPDGTKINLFSPQASNSATLELNQITIR